MRERTDDMADGLTDRQRAVLEMIQGHLEREGASPTLREIAGALRLDPKSVAQHLDRLERKGFLRRRAGESRNIRLTEQARPSRRAARRGLPLVGQVKAGQPVLAEESLEDRVELDGFFGPEGSVFLLRAKGDSMEGAGIRDGDLLAVESGAKVPQGGIGVVLLDGEATVKRVFKEGRGFRLDPENAAYAPIKVAPTRTAEFRVLGAVRGLVRRM
jgi:repressor LexA